MMTLDALGPRRGVLIDLLLTEEDEADFLLEVLDSV
jgi:hypothetical protein